METIVCFAQIIDDNGTSCRKKQSEHQSSASASVCRLRHRKRRTV